ncbi:MAG: hypothetical protein FJX32_15650 [Alphaproteobacteria bacterium]|nr:hypothetical protein [Alphaproteobacteria bacterium]
MISAADRVGNKPTEMNSAVALSVAVRDAVALGEERIVLTLRFSALPRARRLGTQADLLRASWEPLNSTARVRSFKLPGGDLVALGLPHAAADLEYHHQVLFSMLEEEEASRAVQILRLPAQAAAVLDIVHDSLGFTTALGAMGLQASEGGQPDGAAIAAAERAMAGVDISTFVRRQRVMWLKPGGANTRLMWEDLRVKLAEICERLMQSADLALPKAFAERLIGAIDARQISNLARPQELRDMRPIALPLRVESIFSPAFLKLDALIPPSQRQKLLIAFSAGDVLADGGQFILARSFLQARGYPLILEASGPLAVAVLLSLRAGFSYLRLVWSDDFPAIVSGADALMRDTLANPAEHVLLAGADTPAAIAWGWEAGIRMFQGRLIESQRAVS